jgi:cytoskeletal protein RodZ
MASMGELLRDGRDRTGMTVEEVADATNMPRDNIIALEQDALAVLPEELFTRGFIRIYSRVVGIPAEPVLKAYSHALVVQQYALAEPVRRLRRRRFNRRVLGVFMLGLLMFGVVIAVVFTGRLVSPEAQVRAVNAEVETVDELRSGSVVEFTALRPSDFEVFVDGRLGFSGKISGGSRQEWVPQSEMRVMANEGNAIEVRIDGKLVGTLGPNRSGIQRIWRVPIK